MFMVSISGPSIASISLELSVKINFYEYVRNAAFYARVLFWPFLYFTVLFVNQSHSINTCIV